MQAQEQHHVGVCFSYGMARVLRNLVATPVVLRMLPAPAAVVYCMPQQRALPDGWPLHLQQPQGRAGSLCS
jgi:hypothetical protein